MCKKLLLLLLLIPMQAVSQQTTTSAQITDTDGFAWASGHIQISFVPSPSWPSPNSYVWSGGNLQQNSLFNATMNSSGAFSISIPDNTTITPSGSQWQFTICPLATTGCVSWTQAVSGATANLTTALSAVAVGPRFPVTVTGYGYGTIEVFPNPKPGAIFFDTSVATNAPFIWTGMAWAMGAIITIPVGIAQGGTGATTAAGAIANIINGNVIQPSSSETKQSPHVDIEFWGALPTNSAAANRIAINNAIAFAATIGADVFTPAGTYTIDQMITATGVCFDGQSELGSVWQLHTTTNVNAVLFVNGGSHNCVHDMTITTDSTSSQFVTIADLYVLDDAQGDYERIITGSALNASGSSFKMLGGVSDHTSLITSIASNWPSGSGNLPAYGQYYGADGGRCTCPVTIDTPVVGGGSIANFYMNNVQQFTVTGMQNSGGILSTDVENSLDGSISGLVSEAASGTDGVIVNNSHGIVFTGASTGSSTANFHIKASFGTRYENSAVASPILIDSGARGTKLDTLELNIGSVYAPDITNSSPDLTEDNFTDSFGNSAIGSVPKWCSELGGSAPPGTLSAFLAPVISTAGFTPLCQNAVGAPTYWSAIFDGTWQQGGCGGAGLPRILEINQASPTIVCGSHTITVSIQAGVLSAEETGGTGNVLFQGWMNFYPSPNGSGAAGTSALYLGLVGAAGVVVPGGSSSNCLHTDGSNGACSGGGSGTVTSVGFTGGLLSVATPTTTPAFTVAGTSGGIPYFSSASTWASSALLAVNAPVLGGGAGAAPFTSTSFLFGSNTLENSVASNTTNYIGGNDASATSALGSIVVRGANQTGAGGAASAAGNAHIKGGDNAATNVASQAGSIEVAAGQSTGATNQGLQGLMLISSAYAKGGGTSTLWNLQCLVSQMTANDCGASPSSILGVALAVNANTVQVHRLASQTPVNASGPVTVGDTVCAGTTAGKVTDSGGTGPCTTGVNVGIVLAVSGTYALPISGAVTLSTTLPLITVGEVINSKVTPARGIATLASGTVTVSNTAACTPSTSCVYKFTNCGLNGSTAVGVLAVGTVVPGTSFVINSYTALAGIAVDSSFVCWQVN